MELQLFGGTTNPDMAIHELAKTNAQKSIKLSRSMIQVAKFAQQTPMDIAVCSIRELSLRIGVSPASIIRFSKVIGFESFRQMKRCFQSWATKSGRNCNSQIRSDGACLIEQF